MLVKYLNSNLDYLSNTIKPTFPDGMDIEVFDYKILANANKEALLPSEREHVTFYMWKTNKFKTFRFDDNNDLSKYRLTLDHQEDFKLIKIIIEEIYKKNKKFSLNDIILFLERNIKYSKINSKFNRNEGWQESLLMDKKTQFN